MGKIYGYIRMLAKEQDVDNQIITLREIQVKDRDIFIDSFVDNKRSGSDDRTQYEKLFKKLKDKDLLYIQSLNMLGDGYEEIGRQWRMLTKESGCGSVRYAAA